jgi:hypothetical protein
MAALGAALATAYGVTLRVLAYSFHLDTSLRADAIPGDDRAKTEPSGTVHLLRSNQPAEVVSLRP